MNSTNTAATSNTASTITFYGGVYTGELNAAKQPHGKGTYKSADSSYTYEGNYVNGKPLGKGKSIWKSGEIYEGDFEDGNRQGKGKTTLANGDVYEGELVDGLWHGKGKLTYANGKITVGVWHQGELDPKPIMIGSGKAKFVWDDKVYEGAFVNGKRTGKGKMTHSNGTIAQGDYVDGSLSGKGKISWEDGNSYEGDFVNNQLNGKGKMTYVNGNIEEGNWANGVFKGNK